MSQHPYGTVPTTTPAWEQGATRARRSGSRLLGVLSVALAALALCISVAAWFRAAPKPAAAPVYSEQQVAEAKQAVCEAFDLGQQALRVTGRKAGANPAEDFTIAVNSRVAVNSISDYLRFVIAQRPATPDNLIKSGTELSSVYEVVLLKLLSDKTTPELDALYRDLDTSTAEVRVACQ